MRITKVRLKNLNSLVGEWEVDLTAADFTADGIFAIIGPTGAGKTTILDAICLALYGRTPRLDKVTKSTNEIMSRQTGECFAEVEFTTAQGRYRSYWRQHRARQRPDGELQPARHELSDVATGQLLGEKLTDSGHEVVRVTGMDFDRFTRSMLLAQGDFAKFLNASPDERAPILEKITGTQVYSDISRHVHELRAEKAKELELARQEYQGIAVLSDEAEAQVRLELANAQATALAREADISELGAAVTWLKRIESLSEALRDLAEQEARLAVDETEFGPSRQRLQQAKAALELDADYVDLCSVRADQHRDTQLLAAQQGQLAATLAVVESADAKKQAAVTALRLAQQAKEDAAPIIVAARDLDTAIVEKQKPIAQGIKELARKREDARALADAAATAATRLADDEAALAALRDQLDATQGDAGLVGEYAGIKERMDGLISLRAKSEKARGAAAAAREAMTAAGEAVAQAQQELASKTVAADEATAALVAMQAALAEVLDGRTLAELRALREARAQRRDELDDAVASAAAMIALSDETAELADRSRRAGAAVTAAQELQSEAARRGEELAREVDRHDERVRLIGRIASLEEARRGLVDGVACPLCGSLDHPYAQGNVPELSEAERDLRLARAAQEDALQERQRISVELAGHERDVLAIEQRRTEAVSERTGLLERLSQMCRSLDITPPDDNDPGHTSHAALTTLQAEVAEQLDATVQTIRRAEEIDEELAPARDAVNTTATAVADARAAAAKAQFEQERVSAERAGRDSESAERDREFVEALGRVSEALTPYRLEVSDDHAPAAFAAVVATLRERRDQWQRRDREALALEQTLRELRSEARNRADRIAENAAEIAGAEQHLAQLQAELDLARSERHALFGDKDPGSEASRLEREVAAAQGNVSDAEAAASQAAHALAQLTQRIADLTTLTAERADVLSGKEAAFVDRLATSEFDDEAAYRAASLSTDQRMALERDERALAMRRTSLESSRREKNAELSAEQAKAVTTATLEQLQPDLAAATLAKSAADQQVGALRRDLDDNEQAKQESAGARDMVALRERECRRWDDLHELIGSGDGKKFRNFAQGLTFEIMINHANRQLRRMNDRYLLIHDEANPLQLSVVDDYQAGEVRSTRNLSGGESFVVSLALALGLSHMASRNVRVDSLFLDEGFGTLDEDALDNALTTLSSLQQDGKMIGIISHVGALKERIRAQIVVTPKAGGRSVLSGPGCTRR